MSGSVSKAASHASRVRTAYRRILKSHLNWGIMRSQFYVLAEHTRAAFDANRGLTNVSAAARALEDAEAFAAVNTHPDPYVIPELPGGTKYQRNAPPPIEIEHMHPHELLRYRGRFVYNNETGEPEMKTH